MTTPKPGTMPDRIRALIESTPLSTWTIREVADYYGIQENSARAHLSVLQSAGLVRRVPVSFGVVSEVGKINRPSPDDCPLRSAS